MVQKIIWNNTQSYGKINTSRVLTVEHERIRLKI